MTSATTNVTFNWCNSALLRMTNTWTAEVCQAKLLLAMAQFTAELHVIWEADGVVKDKKQKSSATRCLQFINTTRLQSLSFGAGEEIFLFTIYTVL